MSLRAYAAKQSPIKQEYVIKMFSQFRLRLLRRDPSTALDEHSLRSGCSPRNDIILVLFSLILSSCSMSTSPATPQVVTVYSTSAAQPWLSPLYTCAEASAVISRVDDPSSADIVLRVGEPEFLASPAYQIDTEEISVVTHRQSAIRNLTLEETRALFSGQGDPSVQVWVYASDEDVQRVFDKYVMEGRRVASSARVAVNPQQMSDTLIKELDTVGILPRHWNPSARAALAPQSGQEQGDIREVFSVATVPVLAITNSQPQGVVKELLACLQK